MKSSSSKIKYLVITGYLLLVSLMIVGLVSIYRNLVDFSEKRIRDQDVSELLIVSNTISKLYELESSQNLFDAASAETYFMQYDALLPKVHNQIDTLKKLTEDSARIVKLDSIELLLGLKKQNLSEVVVLLDSIQKAPRITRETTSTVVPRKLNTEISDYLQKYAVLRPDTTAQVDTTVVYGNRRGFFSRVRDVFVARTDSVVMVERSITRPVEEFKALIDTVVNMVRYSERLDLENQKKLQYVLLQRQAAMAGTNASLTAQIDGLLKEIEKEELDKSLQLIYDKDKALSKSQRIMYIVSWLAVGIAVIFGILFFADINRSQRYRRQLEASNRRVTELLKSREQLMLAVSHDIKAPMSSILGYIELMQTEIPPDKKHLYLKNMKNSGEHVLQLIANLLDYHKLESGTMALKEVNVNLYDLTDTIINSFKPLAHQKQLNYVVNNRLRKDFIGYADPYLIRQIMSNVISNAVKYTFHGSVSVVVDETRKNGEPWIEFSVKDTGIGIDKADQQVVFEEFRQLNARTDNHRVEGSGLGLAITRRLVDELGGNIALHSEKGRGSEFIIGFPFKAEQKNEENAVLLVQTQEYAINNVSVLVVDDDTVQLKMVSEMLLLKKVDVHTENNPENVMGILFSRQFDILFTDIQMPQMNGFELVRKIRELPHYKTVPIIALSAKSDVSETDLASAGFTGFLTKPFTSETLYAAVFNHVKGGKTPSVQPAETNGEAAGVQALIHFVKDDKDAALQILGAFIKDTVQNRDKLAEAIDANNYAEKAHLAHKMLPLFKMTADTKLVSVLQKMENKQSILPEEGWKALKRINAALDDARKLHAGYRKMGNGWKMI